MIENQLIKSFFDDKLELNYDFVFVYQDGSEKEFNLKIVFKEKITDFMFDKLCAYTSLDITEDESNYNKVKIYLAKIIDKIIVDGIDENEYTTLQVTLYYLKQIISKIKKDLIDLKKK